MSFSYSLSSAAQPQSLSADSLKLPVKPLHLMYTCAMCMCQVPPKMWRTVSKWLLRVLPFTPLISETGRLYELSLQGRQCLLRGSTHGHSGRKPAAFSRLYGKPEQFVVDHFRLVAASRGKGCWEIEECLHVSEHCPLKCLNLSLYLEHQ